MQVLLKQIAKIIYKKTIKAQSQGTYVVDLSKTSKDWLDGQIMYPMDRVWRGHGIEASGLNYFTVGKPDSTGRTSRFNSDSKMFQSWLGVYVVRFNNLKEWLIEDHFELSVADQKNWLKLYGVKRPKVSIIQDETENLGSIIVSGFNGTLYEGSIVSDIDVPKKELHRVNRYIAEGVGHLYNFCNAYSKQDELNRFTPKPSIDDISKVKLRGYIAILELDSWTKAVLYINAAQFKVHDGTLVDYFGKNSEQLLIDLKSIVIRER